MSIRVFVAATLAPSVNEEMTKVQALLRAAGGDVRWVRPRNFHLTFRFLGTVAPARVEKLLAALCDAVRHTPRLRVRVRGLGAFPTLDRPHVVWAGVAGRGLSGLAATLDAALTDAEFSSPRAGGQAFHPHVTLGRVRSRRGWKSVLPRVQRHLRHDFGDSPIDAVSLYRSDLRPDGAVHTVLGTAGLRSTAAVSQDVGLTAVSGLSPIHES